MDCNWLILRHAALTKIKCIPMGYITASYRSMVESGVREGGKNTARSCQFSFP